jgi:adenosylhomocysteine nucleosidase
MLGIIGAMEDEVSFLRGALKESKTKKTAEFEFYTGELEGKAVAILRSGIGKVNAAAGCTLLINLFKPDFVINTGSAGGIAPGLKFGDAIISERLVYHDVDLTAFNYAPGQLPGQPPEFEADKKLVMLAEQAVKELKEEKILPGDFSCRRGLVGSGDVFIHEPERIAFIRKLFPDVLAVEMEGTAIAHCCRLFSVPFLIIRALSDIAGIESPIKFSEFLPIASKRSAEIVCRIIKNSL